MRDQQGQQPQWYYPQQPFTGHLPNGQPQQLSQWGQQSVPPYGHPQAQYGGQSMPNYAPPQQQSQWLQPQWPSQQPQWPPQPPFQQGPSKPPKKGFFSKKIGPIPVWVLILVLIVLVSVAANAGKGSSSGSTDTTQSSSTPSSSNSGVAQPTVAPTKVPTQAPTPAPKWTTIQTFTGNGIKKTTIFPVGNDWKIIWSCTPSSFYGGQYNIQITVYNSDGTPADLAVNTICQSGNTGDSTEEHQAGDVYLDINSEAAWKIQVQELK